MQVTVYLLAFEDAGTRIVDIPDEEAQGATPEELLDLTFHYGQNDFQKKPVRSVSVGDVIDLEAGLFRVRMVGFEKLNPFTKIGEAVARPRLL